MWTTIVWHVSSRQECNIVAFRTRRTRRCIDDYHYVLVSATAVCSFTIKPGQYEQKTTLKKRILPWTTTKFKSYWNYSEYPVYPKQSYGKSCLWLFVFLSLLYKCKETIVVWRRNIFVLKMGESNTEVNFNISAFVCDACVHI